MQRWLFVVTCACSNMTGPNGGGGDDGSNPGQDGATADVPGGGSDEPAELAGITLAHNQARAAVQTQPALPSLAWDPKLAQIAATWVAMCKDSDGDGLVDHDPDRTNGSGYGYVGENIYASSGQGSAQEAVQLWVSEKSDYNYANNSCSGVCGHYTQVVWRDTTHLGCALHDCPGLQYSSTIVCDYGPGGNVNGERPY
jgi:pathogenesis-related protein 1